MQCDAADGPFTQNSILGIFISTNLCVIFVVNNALFRHCFLNIP